MVSLISVAALVEPNALAQPPETTPSWTLTGNLNTPRWGHTATLLPNGKVLVVGGITNTAGTSNVLNSAELYDPAAGTWSETGSLNLPRYLCSTTLLANGKVLVAGGNTKSNPPPFGITSTVELYDPATGSWTLSGDLSAARAWHAATPLSTGVLVFGGWNGSSSVNTAEIYNPDTGEWSLTGDLMARRYGPTATLLRDGKVLVAGGSDNEDLMATLGNVELYDPVMRIWKSSYHLGTARISHSATLLPEGMVLVVGGYIWPPRSLSTSELYDPATEQWSYRGNLRVARDCHTAIFLPNGKVLVAGGYNWPGRASLNSTELYDPPTGTWSDTANLNTARSHFTGTLLPNGKVLVAGGTGSSTLNSAELYDSGINFGEARNPANTP